MELEDVLKEFGTGYKLCKLLNIKIQNISHWKKQGYIPEIQQRRIEDISKTGLKMKCRNKDN